MTTELSLSRGPYAGYESTIELWREAHGRRAFDEARRLARTIPIWFDSSDKTMFVWATTMVRKMLRGRRIPPLSFEEKISDVTLSFNLYLRGSVGHLAAVDDQVTPAHLFEHLGFRRDAWRRARWAFKGNTDDIQSHMSIGSDSDGGSNNLAFVIDESHLEDDAAIDPSVALDFREDADLAARLIEWAISGDSTLSRGDQEIVSFERGHVASHGDTQGLTEALARHLYPNDCTGSQIAAAVLTRTRQRLSTAHERLKDAILRRAHRRLASQLSADARRLRPAFTMQERVALTYFVEAVGTLARPTLLSRTKAHLADVLGGADRSTASLGTHESVLDQLTAGNFANWIDGLVHRLWQMCLNDFGSGLID